MFIQNSDIICILGSGNRLAGSQTTATNTYFVSGTSSVTIGTDDTWGTLYISNLTANTAVIPDVNGSSFSAEVPVLGDCTNTLVVAIRDEAGNMGYATNHLWVGDFTTENTEAQSFGYDSAGCLTNLNGVSLAWDERYRLTSVSSASSVVQYSYDVLGRRVSRIESEISNPSSAITNLFVYNGNQVVADLDGDGNLLRTYVWGTGIDNLLCFTDHTTSNTYYAVKDHQNTVLALVDESGIIAESYEYTAYGETRVFDASGSELTESALGNRYTFQGREIDWAIGLIYFRARWYDPDSGRWLSKDPIGIAGGLNLYEFCASNPVNFVDPMGLRLTTQEIGNIIFNETRSLSGPDLHAARVALAHTIITGDAMKGSNRPKTAPSTVGKVPEVEQASYEDAQCAAKEARNERNRGYNPTGNAMNFNLRPNNSTSPFFGHQHSQQFGPFNNSYPQGGLPSSGVYINIYE